MVTIRAPTKTWVAKEGELYIGKSEYVTVGAGTTLSGSFTSASTYSISAACKNITVTPPDTNWEKQDFIGRDTNSFQNQLLDEKPVGTATLNASMVLGENETIENVIFSGVTAILGAYSRYQIGNVDNGSVSVCVTVAKSDASDYVAFMLDNAKVTKWGDVKISGPDGHWEQEVTVVCLAKDFYYEFKD